MGNFSSSIRNEKIHIYNTKKGNQMDIILQVRNEGKNITTTIEDIRINKKLSDVIELEKKYNNFTWEFEVVGDKSFNEFMNYSYSINTQYNFNPNKSLDATISIDDAGELIKGSLRLLNTIKVENGNIIYTMQLTGFIRDLFSIMDDHTLSSLDFSEYNHGRTIQHIKESMEGSLYKWGNLIVDEDQEDREGYVYPHIIYNSADDVSTHLYLNNLFPAIYFKTIIQKIEEKLNVDLGDFLKSDVWNNVVMPYTADNIKKTDEEVSNQTTRVGYTQTYDITPWRVHGTSWWKNFLYPHLSYINPGVFGYQNIYGLVMNDTSSNVINSGQEYQFQDPLSAWNGETYICKVAGYYDIRFNGKLRCQLLEAFGNNIEYDGGGSLEYYYNLRINGQVVDQSFNPSTGGNTLFITPPSGSHTSPWTIRYTLVMNLSQRNVFLEPTDFISIDYGFRHSGSVKWKGNDELIDARLLLDRSEVSGSSSFYTSLEVEPSDNNSYGGEEFSLSSILPDDLTIKDFIGDLIRMCNLVVIPKGNEDGRMKFDILPENEYFAPRSDKKSLNEKLDNYSKLSILPMNESNYKQYILKLQDDGDMYNKDFKDNTSETYGRKRLNLDNDFTNDKKEIKPENIASSIISDEYCVRPSIYFLKEDLTQFKGKIRLLQTKSLGSPNWQIWRSPDSIVRVNLSSYIYAGSWDDPFYPQFNINFSTPNKVYHNTSKVPNEDLYSRYWKTKIENIINPDSKRITIENAYMSYLDYIEFDFRDVYTLDGVDVRITSLGNYNPSTERLNIEAYTLLVDVDFTPSPRSVDGGVPTKNDYGYDYEDNSTTKGLTNENQFDKTFTIPEKVNSLRKGLNSQNNSKSILNGQRSIVKDSLTNVMNNGNKVNILNRVSNAIVSDNNKTVRKDGIYVANTKMEKGLKSFKWNSVYIINGNDYVWKTNDTDILSGGEDSVRNKGGIRYDRVILNGNIEGSSIFGNSSDGIS